MGSALNPEQAVASRFSLSPELTHWLTEHALALDVDAGLASELLPKLAQNGLFSLGLNQQQSPLAHGQFADAVQAVIELAQRSLTAAFVLWGQRTFIEYVLQTQEQGLRDTYLSSLLSGATAGATGLSNAIKFLGGIEQLSIQAQQDGDSWILNGKLPWVTNLRQQGFVVAVAVRMPDGSSAICVLDDRDEGVERGADLDLIALRSSSTASLVIRNVRVSAARLLHAQAEVFIPAIRPRFLALQCGMAIGLGLRCAQQVLEGQKASATQQQEAQSIQTRLFELCSELIVLSEQAAVQAKDLFRIRIEVSALVASASALEVAHVGGAVYLEGVHPEVLRRTREALFIPLISPTVAQLSAELEKHSV